MKYQILRCCVAFSLVTSVITPAAAADAPDAVLKKVIAATARSPENSTRDIYRHPFESLAFWGFKPGQTVVEIEAGGGYWLEILAAYAKATGGRYGATFPDTSKIPAADLPKVAEYKAKFEKFGPVNWVTWSEDGGGPLGPAGSADLVLTARNIHDWMWVPGQLDKALSDFYAVLKPGGILAVEDHRADPRPQVVDAHDGYVNTKVLVAAVEKAGFKLEASSEINANPKDTKDYPLGVWTLPPTNAKQTFSFMLPWPGLHPEAKLEPEKYKAIGESDRMTLRFRKP